MLDVSESGVCDHQPAISISPPERGLYCLAIGEAENATFRPGFGFAGRILLSVVQIA